MISWPWSGARTDRRAWIDASLALAAHIGDCGSCARGRESFCATVGAFRADEARAWDAYEAANAGSVRGTR